MKFRPQKWLNERLCPYCGSSEVHLEGESAQNLGVDCYWYCFDCKSGFMAYYDFHSLRTDRGDAYPAARIRSSETILHGGLEQKLSEVKLVIADTLIFNQKVALSHLKKLVKMAQRIHHKLRENAATQRS
jgi:hypothetical protein